MAVIAGLTVANCYYNQPLLEMIRHDIGVSQHETNLITVVTQTGYALGLCFLIPMGDLYSRRRIIVVNMTVAEQKQEYGYRPVGIANRHSRIESG